MGTSSLPPCRNRHPPSLPQTPAGAEFICACDESGAGGVEAGPLGGKLGASGPQALPWAAKGQGLGGELWSCEVAAVEEEEAPYSRCFVLIEQGKVSRVGLGLPDIAVLLPASAKVDCKGNLLLPAPRAGHCPGWAHGWAVAAAAVAAGGGCGARGCGPSWDSAGWSWLQQAAVAVCETVILMTPPCYPYRNT